MKDVAYYQRRLDEELVAITRANCPKAAEAHRQMAQLYRSLLNGGDAAGGVTVVRLRPASR